MRLRAVLEHSASSSSAAVASPRQMHALTIAPLLRGHRVEYADARIGHRTVAEDVERHVDDGAREATYAFMQSSSIVASHSFAAITSAMRMHALSIALWLMTSSAT